MEIKADIAKLSEAAERGEAEAQFALAAAYYWGKGVVEIDHKKAFSWFTKSAEQGNAEAMALLALLYKQGHGVGIDYNEAAKWDRKAAELGFDINKSMDDNVDADLASIRAMAEQGDAVMQMSLATMYLAGKGVKQSYKDAAEWYFKAAVQGNAIAQQCMGMLFQTGKGVVQDTKEAERWYLKSAGQENVQAQLSLGTLYAIGKGVGQDYKESFKWYLRAAERGSPEAQAIAGSFYSQGKGTEQDNNEAAKWYLKAAGQGDAVSQSNIAVFYQTGKGVEQDYKEAFKWYLKAAGQGNAIAQSGLASLYQTGKGVEQDYKESFKWYYKVAEQGNPDAEYMVGALYERGLGVTKSDAEAAGWYNKAAEHGYAKAKEALDALNQRATKDGKTIAAWRIAAEEGDASAQVSLGTLYDLGRTIPQDYAEAIKWYGKAANQGNIKAQIRLGSMYSKGQGVKQDYAEAVKWYRKAADQGDVAAQANLGVMYYAGRGIPQDYAEAARWLRQAAEQGNAISQSSLGNLYYSGQGVSKDWAEAVKWYKKAAEQGNAAAQRYLGGFYDTGLLSFVAQDYAEAIKWYRKAADQGDAGAQHSLGFMFDTGHGVEKDYAEATKWYRKSADQGNRSAQRELGEVYHKGLSVAQDYAEAMKWYRKAADQGDGWASFYIGTLYEDGLGVAPDNSEALKWYKKAADLKIDKAKLKLDILGKHLEKGDIKQNAKPDNLDDLLRRARDVKIKPEADKLIADAVTGGAATYYRLGKAISYSRDGLFKKDKALATQWIKCAADLGDADALEDMGDYALNDKRYPDAAHYYSLATESGNGLAHVKYAYCMIFGLGIPKDVSGGFELLRVISEKSNASGYLLANSIAKESVEKGTMSIMINSCFLENSVEGKFRNKDGSFNITDLEEYFSGERISEKYTTGTLAYIKLASEHKPSAYFAEHKDAVMKAARDGDIPSLIEWTRNTLEYSKRPAEIERILKELEEPSTPSFEKYRKGSVCSSLGTALGPESTVKGEYNELSVLWFKKSVEAGFDNSANRLGNSYMRCRDYETGFKYHTTAAAMGNVSSRLTCALCLLCGLGTPQDIDSGYQRIRELSGKKDITEMRGEAQAAINALETGTVDPLYIISALGQKQCDALKNEDRTINISDLEYFFSGTRNSEKFFKSSQEKKSIRMQISNEANEGKKPMTDQIKKETAAAASHEAVAPAPDTKKQTPDQIKIELAPAAAYDKAKSPIEDLHDLIGLERVKESLQSVSNQMVFLKMRQKAGLPFSGFNLHFVFSGNPGTGKTTVARILGRILRDVGYLTKGHVIEVSDKDLIGEYVGQTAPKMAAKVNEAMGGILFIDEAYSLVNHAGATSDFGDEAISTLLKLMEDRREEFVVIAAGYPKEMLAFVNANPGFKSRFTEFIAFEDYQAPELEKIFIKMADDNKYILTSEAQGALQEVMVEGIGLFEKNFSNGRFVRNLFEDTVKNIANRVVSHKDPLKIAGIEVSSADLTRIEKADLMEALEDARNTVQEERSNPIGFNAS